ncbi:hypothetical protein E2562_019928 [Oryza meyeriana var. granulata]|uniref:Uncharacterized protein n=1 Tax=Oryza meyeriana var. granulata TaxID=110450 RepID=A0A6G1EXI2_9ORYZ|nr:hypothetical protein E2562_019928 [Oryza meyeriana var. granulata]
MESLEEMVTLRAAASEAGKEEQKAATLEVPVEVVEAGEEVMVDALPPEAAGVQEQQGKVSWWHGDQLWLWLQLGSGQHGGIAVGCLMHSLVRRDRLSSINLSKRDVRQHV